MTYLDWIIIVILAVSTITGAIRGVIKELLSVFIWLSAVLAVIAFNEALAYHLPFLQEQTMLLRRAVSSVVLLVTVILLGSMIRYLLSKLVETSGLQGTDRTLGMVFGLIRGGLIVIVTLMLLNNYMQLDSFDFWKKSQLKPTFLKYSQLATETLTLLKKVVYDDGIQAVEKIANDIRPSETDVVTEISALLKQTVHDDGIQTVEKIVNDIRPSETDTATETLTWLKQVVYDEGIQAVEKIVNDIMPSETDSPKKIQQ